MKNYAKVIGFILLLFFCALQSNTLAEDAFSPGPGWQEIPAYGPELQFLADWQEASADNPADDDAAETFYNAPSGGTDSVQPNETSPITGSGSSDMSNISNSPMLPLPMVTAYLTKGLGLGGTIIDDPSQLEPGTATVKLKNWTVLGGTVTYALTPEEATRWYTTFNSVGGWSDKPLLKGTELTADFDPSKPGLETKYNMISPLILDTDRNGTIALDGGTIPFDIAPHLAGLETIPVPAEGKDMFLVWDKAGTETIEGAVREYKEGEIIDITELFGPEDYTRSDFSVLAYSDDGFTKLAKLCDVNKDGRVDKEDTALSAEVAAKLKLWSPLSGELILFKDTDIVVDVRSGSYERHPSDIEGWAVEYKMKDAQGRLLGYQWLSSKTSTPLCVDVLLAVQ